MQEGNCFDLSILLTSLLCGVGYDAYVVSGYASLGITLMDESHTNVDQLEMLANALGFYSNFSKAKMEKQGDDFWISGEEALADTTEGKEEYGDHILKNYKSAEVVQDNKYKTKAPRSLASQFIMKREVKKAEKEKEVAEKRRIEWAIERAVRSGCFNESFLENGGNGRRAQGASSSCVGSSFAWKKRSRRGILYRAKYWKSIFNR